MLNIGVIGAGNIGHDHIQRMTHSVAGARIAAVFDVAQDRAQQVADEVGAVAVDDANSLISDDRIEAVIIASPGHLHPEQALACLAVEKPVLCEKPLATTVDDGLRVLEAEVALGRRLIQVGFMRRYDPGYRRVKEVLRSGGIGEPLMAHSVHRNPTVPASFTGDMSLTDSVVHEMDVTRWLFGTEVTAVTVVAPRRTPLAAPHMQDPQLVLMETENGILVDVESFVSCQYGYDVRCEVVGSTGTVSLDTPSFGAVTTQGVRGHAVPADWRIRFGEAYRIELQEWVDSVASGKASGPSSWDGYAATAIAAAAVQARTSGARTEVKLVDKPSLYG